MTQRSTPGRYFPWSQKDHADGIHVNRRNGQGDRLPFLICPEHGKLPGLNVLRDKGRPIPNIVKTVCNL